MAEGSVLSKKLNLAFLQRTAILFDEFLAQIP
jgi:hypothetical protein